MTQYQMNYSDVDGRLVIVAQTETAAWVRRRFGRLLAMCGSAVGREWRFAEEFERQALAGTPAGSSMSINQKEAAG